MSFGFVYIWRDRKHKRYYIGAHWGTENDGYICSSSWMMNAYNRRKEDFKRRILKRIYTDKKDMFLEEQKYLNMVKDEELGKKYYNLNKTWQHWSFDDDKSLSVKEKISKANSRKKKPKFTEEHKRKISEALKGVKLTDSHRKALSMAHKGKKISEEHKTKLSKAMKGRKLFPFTEEHKRNISISKTGTKRVPFTEEHKRKISEAIQRKYQIGKSNDKSSKN